MAIDKLKSVDIIISKITEDLIPQQTVIQGERSGRSLVLQITNGGEIVDQTGTSVNLGWSHTSAKNSDGELLQGLDAFKPLDIKKGIFELEYPSGMLVPGIVNATIQIITSTSDTRSNVFKIKIEDAPFDDEAAESDNSFTALQDALSKATSISSKADYKYVDEKVSSIVSGTPKDAVANYQELQSKYPNGLDGIVVTSDNGHWHYWKNGTWNDGGMYQSDGLADGSVTEKKLADQAANYLKTNFLELDTSRNLFDGIYQENTRLDGLSGSLLYKEFTGAKTAIIKIKPNTKYSIGRYQSSRFNYGTSTKKLNFGENLDGAINVNASGSGETTTPQIVTFTSGANDRYLYINTSVSNQEIYLKVVEGELKEVDPNEPYPIVPTKNVDLLAKSDFEQAKFDTDKMTYFEPLNLFDGKYIKDTAVQGASPWNYISRNGGRTAVISIKPNTTYSIGREVPSRFNYGTSSKILQVGESLDGAVKENMSGSGTTDSPQIVTFTSGANDRYLYINTSVDNSEPFLIVREGEVKEIGPHDYGRVKHNAKVDVLSEAKAIQLIKEQVPELSQNRKIKIVGNGDGLVQIFIPSQKNSNYVRYDYRYIDSVNLNMHQWRVLKTYVVDGQFNIIMDLDDQTEWEGAIKEVGAVDFVGGTHGDERNVAINLLVDGKEFDINEVFSAFCNEIKIVNESILNRSKTPDQDILHRFKISEWTKEFYTVENRYTALESFKIDQSKITLCSCKYDFVNKGRTDHDFKVESMNISGVGTLSVKHKDIRKMEFWGDDLYLSAECIADFDKYENTNQYVENFPTQNRAKMYFDVTGRYDIALDEQLRNKSIYKILA